MAPTTEQLFQGLALIQDKEVLIEKVLEIFSDDSLSQEQLEEIVDYLKRTPTRIVRGTAWGKHHFEVYTYAMAKACSSVAVDFVFWITFVGADHLSDDQMSMALSHPLMTLFFETWTIEEFEHDKNLVKGNVVRAFCERLVNSYEFYLAMDKWRAKESWRKKLGSMIGVEKRYRKTIRSSAFSLIFEATKLSGGTLVAQMGTLLSFEKILEEVHAQRNIELPRSKTMDKLRELISADTLSWTSSASSTMKILSDLERAAGTPSFRAVRKPPCQIGHSPTASSPL
jgi:hypothetical protein